MNFNQKVWNLCRKIPKGRVSSYKEIAKALNTKAYRAVGNALNKNSYKRVPCHRVVNSDGKIGGFARGIKAKRKLLQKEGIKVLDLPREKAIKIEVENKLRKFSPNLVVFNGHGSEDVVTGHKNEELITVGKNETLLKNKIVYAISCRSAKNLGEKSINAGTISYNGYDEDFIFVYDPNKITTPCGDSTAKLFLEHSQIFIEAIIKRNTIEEAKKKAENILKENIKTLLGSNQDPSLVRYLWWDLKHFVSLGDIRVAIQ